MDYYIALLCVYGFFAIIETSVVFSDRGKKILCFLLLFPIWAMSSFRAGTVGNDTGTYIYAFNSMRNYASLRDAIQGSRMESGYVAISYWFAQSGASYLLFQAVTNTFIYYSLWRFIAKHSNNIGFSCFIFLTMRMFVGPMNTVRAWLAIAVILFSVPFLMNKKLIPFATMVGIASLFHTTALVFVILYPICNIELIKRNKWLIIFSAIVIAIVGRPFFAWLTNIIGKYDNYLDGKYFVDFNKTAIYLTLAIDLCFGLLLYITRSQTCEDVIVQTEAYNVTEIFSSLMMVIIAFDIVGLTNTIMSRVSDYFQVFYLLMIPQRVEEFVSRESRMIILSVILLMLALQWGVVMVYRPNWNGVTPFVWFFQ